MEKWIQDKEERIMIFHDTEEWYRSDPELKRAIEDSVKGTVFYPANSEIPVKERAKPAALTITKEKSLEAAFNFLKKRPNAKVCVHNFASATHPGGGVHSGSTAQEEALCRCSTLFPCLATDELYNKYYSFHRKRKDAFYTDAVIYTPGVKAIKSDVAFPQRLPRESWITVDVLSCAAPNLRAERGEAPKLTDPAAFTELYAKRAGKIIKAASAGGADVLITGAFGCGAFKNPPELAAQAWRKAILDNRNALEEIIFAIYCTPNNENNYWAFKGALSR